MIITIWFVFISMKLKHAYFPNLYSIDIYPSKYFRCAIRFPPPVRLCIIYKQSPQQNVAQPRGGAITRHDNIYVITRIPCKIGKLHHSLDV